MLLEQLLNGLVVGSICAPVALGFCLVFGVLNTLNFAHSGLFMFAGYLAVALLAVSVPLVAAGVLGCVGGGVAALAALRKSGDRHIQSHLLKADEQQKIWRFALPPAQRIHKLPAAAST